MTNNRKRMMIALGIVLTVSLSTGLIASAANPFAADKQPASTAQAGESKSGKCPQGSANQKNAGSKAKPKAKRAPNGSPLPALSASPSSSSSPARVTNSAVKADSASNAVQAVGTVTITGGFNTASEDNGRPVVLIAAALGVPTEVFREAFSGVTPAGHGSGGPTGEEAQKNKSALMSVLSAYNITNKRLDEVSNFYRYNGSRGEVWSRTSAKATAIITNGVITGVKITNLGAGYTSVPTVTIMGPNGKITAIAKLAYTSDFATNGSISTITIQ